MTAVVFDLDGTLVDSAPAIRDIANTLMIELGLALLDLDETRGYIGNGAAAFVERALRARAVHDPAAFATHLTRFEELYCTAPGDANIAYPGVDKVLAHLVENGARLAICTNKPTVPTHAVIEAKGWSELFSAIIAGDTLATRKPSPEPLFEAARRLDAAPTIYVGDSEIDAATAEAAAIPFILYTEGYRKKPIGDLPHAAAFSDFADLPGLIAGLPRG